MRIPGVLLCLAAGVLAGPTFKGKIVRTRGRTVTVLYDFSDPGQLEDFERVLPPHLAEHDRCEIEIDEGWLRLEGSGALRHKVASSRLVHARFKMRVSLKHNLGTFFCRPDPSGQVLLLNLYDRRHKTDGALRLSVCEKGATRGEPLAWRELAHAGTEAVDKRIRKGEAVDVEVKKRGAEEFVRIGDLYLQRSSEKIARPFAAYHFGVWTFESRVEIGELQLTFELAEPFPVPPDPKLAGHPAGRLGRTVERAPLSQEAAAARRELSRRGPDGWKKLAALIRYLARKRPYAAVPVVADLGDGQEPERRELLLALLKKFARTPDLRAAIIRALADWYPADAGLLHKELRGSTPDRLELFRFLVSRGLPDKVVADCCSVDALAVDAYEVLKDRGARLDALQLGRLPRTRALEGFSPAAARDSGRM